MRATNLALMVLTLPSVHAYAPANGLFKQPLPGHRTIVMGAKGGKAKGKSKAVATRGGAGGFGAKPAPAAAKPAAAAPAFGADATRFLASTGGDLNRAQSLMFQSELMSLREADAALFDKVVELQRSQPAQPPPELAAAHQKLTELTWDVISAFMLPSDKPSAAQQKQLDRVAEAARLASGPHAESSSELLVHDIGCGNGLLLPSLVKSGLGSATRYVGCDLSRRMIEAASAAWGHTGARFAHVGFPEVMEGSEGKPAPPASAIIFNGSLQFFASPADTIKRAAAHLAPGGRLVIAHVNGAAFVRQEQQGNPTTVLSTMPSLDELEDLAADAGLRVVMDPDRPPPDLDAFYLVALQRSEEKD